MVYFPLLLAILITAIYFWNDKVRKGSLKTIQSHYSETFFTRVPPYRCFKAIMEFATKNGYQIDDFDEQQLAVILNERITLTGYGHLYPIYVREHGGRTLVEVGVTSKLPKYYLISPVNKKFLTLRLERMLDGIKGAVFAYGGTDEGAY